ncbi:hypothetical protein BDW74DRAFT_145538 [Aspergillus multicolor]|uniref:uncharacterized protein n=1 Tax=Aspergillus multicolor TaxID=41759 RepID=UPI003CCCB053
MLAVYDCIIRISFLDQKTQSGALKCFAPLVSPPLLNPYCFLIRNSPAASHPGPVEPLVG